MAFFTPFCAGYYVYFLLLPIHINIYKLINYFIFPGKFNIFWMIFFKYLDSHHQVY